jgi:hypothetical protein
VISRLARVAIKFREQVPERLARSLWARQNETEVGKNAGILSWNRKPGSRWGWPSQVLEADAKLESGSRLRSYFYLMQKGWHRRSQQIDLRSILPQWVRTLAEDLALATTWRKSFGCSRRSGITCRPPRARMLSEIEIDESDENHHRPLGLFTYCLDAYCWLSLSTRFFELHRPWKASNRTSNMKNGP